MTFCRNREKIQMKNFRVIGLLATYDSAVIDTPCTQFYANEVKRSK